MVLDLKVVRVHKLNGGGPTKAMCDISIGNEFLIKGFCVIQGKKGLFVGVPREVGKDGKWYDRAFPLTESAKEALNETVLAAYEDS